MIRGVRAFFGQVLTRHSTRSLTTEITHPDTGQKLLGPFWKTCHQTTIERAIESNSLALNDTEETTTDRIEAYYPKLSAPTRDYHSMIDYLSGTNIYAHLSLIFYTPVLPKIEHEQLTGLAVSWLKKDLPQQSLPIVPVITNDRDKVKILDPALARHLKNLLLSTASRRGYQDIQRDTDYIQMIFAELGLTNGHSGQRP